MNVFAVWLGACAKKICSTFCFKKGGKIFAAQNQFKGEGDSKGAAVIELAIALYLSLEAILAISSQ